VDKIMDIEICKKCVFYFEGKCIASNGECPYIELGGV
jgi:hypothetical protein